MITKLTKLTLASAVLCLSATGVHANAILNGGFETGDLTSWTTVIPPGGSVTVAGSHFGAGLSPNLFPTEGSLMAIMKTDGPGSLTTLSQTFNKGPGKLWFDWLFDSAEFSGFFNDTASVSVDGLISGNLWWKSLSVAGSTCPGGGCATDTGWITEMVILPIFDTYTINFSITNSQDSIVDSYLLVDNVIAVPEPAPFVLLATGLIVMAGVRRRASHRAVT